MLIHMYVLMNIHVLNEFLYVIIDKNWKVTSLFTILFFIELYLTLYFSKNVFSYQARGV